MFLRFFAILILAGVVFVILRELTRRRGAKLKCADCRHCRKLFEDGVRCGFGDKEVFKNVVHIENCGDFER